MASVKMDLREATEAKKSDTMSPLTLAALFVAWYAFNAGYNVYNGFIKSSYEYPHAISSLSLIVGVVVYAIPLYVLKLRKMPKISFSDFLRLLPVVVLNATGHLSAVLAMFQKGGGSFTHVIKASEPVVSVILALLINGVVPRPLTAISLLPITYGVAYASTLGNLDTSTMARDLTTWTAIFAMTSNVTFSLRSIVRKNLPKDFKDRTGLDASNDHAATTLLSFLLLCPCVFIFESPSELIQGYNNIQDKNKFYFDAFMCGICFYLYNELQNIVLGALGPVPTAVGNTLKRVVIFVALFFCVEGETFPMPKIIGSAIAVVGCLIYAVCDAYKL